MNLDEQKNNFAWQDIDDMAWEDGVTNDDLFAEMIGRQCDIYGPEIKEPCLEARELLIEWSTDSGDDVVAVWRGHVARLTPGAKPRPVENDELDVETLNDAELTGEPCEVWDALEKTEVTVTGGKVFTDKNRKNKSTLDNKWNGQKTPWQTIIDGEPGKEAVFADDRRVPWGLSRHPQNENKDGFGYVFGNCLTHRRANAVASICALVIDADTGHVSFDDAVKSAQKLGFAVIAHTSHSHLTTTTELKRDNVVKHAECNGDPSIEEVRAYVSGKKGLAPHIVESIQIEESRAQTPDGEMVVVKHAPIHKYRMIFPLAEGDVTLSGLANTQQEEQNIFASKLRGLADMLGIPTDPATLDVSRFFYAPRHRKGAEHRTVIHRAPPIKFTDVPVIEGSRASSQKKSERRADIVTSCGFNVSKNRRNYGKRQRFADIMEGTGAYISSAGSDKAVIRCAFHDEHTEQSDDTATVAWNPDAHMHGFGSITCQHTCKDRYGPEDYIARYIKDGILDSDFLVAADFMDPLPDDAVGEKFAQPTPDEIEEGVAKEDPNKWVRSPFKVKNGCVYKMAGEGSEKPDMKLCQTFEVIGRSSNMAGDNDAGRIITFNNENGVLVEKTLDLADLFKSDGGGVIDDLARAGMRLYFSGRNGRSDFLDLLRSAKSDRRIPIAKHGGWTRDQTGRVTGFLAPTGEYIPAQKDAPEMRLHSTGMVEDVRAFGTLDGWKLGASAAQHNFFWQFGLCAGFTGTVLDLIEGSTCGVNFSGESSKGKTIALMLGTACWATLANGKRPIQNHERDR